MTKIPKISKIMQKKHAGQSAAVVDGKIVAFGKDSLDAEKNAVKKGYLKSDVMTAFIMGAQNYVI
ncbi:hypothetical protein KKC94_04240 [Patescibacteria group bacterium]|nr:hypothetical protein [Patescibacteria group bacterium]